MPLRASIAATSRPSRSDMNLIFGSVTSGIEAVEAVLKFNRAVGGLTSLEM